jgi:biopolymer transport protein ExbD
VHVSFSYKAQEKKPHRNHSNDRCDDVFNGFFVLISINVIPSMGIKTRQPQSSQAQNLSNPEKPVVITLAKDDQIQVDGQNTSLEELVKTILKSSSKKDNLSIIINSDEAARVQRLVDVMDEIKKSDIGKVTLAAKSKP